jgi:hypothetical protein
MRGVLGVAGCVSDGDLVREIGYVVGEETVGKLDWNRIKEARAELLL